jgi:dienelactone hydrolase
MSGHRTAPVPAFLRSLWVLLLLLSSLVGAPALARARLTAPPALVLGEPDAITASSLRPGASYTLSVEQEDEQGQHWCAVAQFRADRAGHFSTASSAALSGAYQGVDAQALFWGGAPCDRPAGTSAASPHADFRGVAIMLRQGPNVLASRRQIIWLKSPEVLEESLQPSLPALLLLPHAAPKAAVIVVGGSEGGIVWARRIGALLAHQGYAALALAYLRYPGLGDQLAEIPIERVGSAAAYLAHRFPGIPVVVLGYSRGAELALLAAAHFEAIHAVIAISPASIAFQSYQAPNLPPVSSWSFGGAPVPYLPYRVDDRFRQSGDGVYLRLRSLADSEASERAAIPVERINGPLLLLSGTDDRVWPATLMAEQIRARLRLTAFHRPFTHIAFPGAGHMIFGPGYSPTALQARYGGGTPGGNARAQLESWRATLDFLDGLATGRVSRPG